MRPPTRRAACGERSWLGAIGFGSRGTVGGPSRPVGSSCLATSESEFVCETEYTSSEPAIIRTYRLALRRVVSNPLRLRPATLALVTGIVFPPAPVSATQARPEAQPTAAMPCPKSARTPGMVFHAPGAGAAGAAPASVVAETETTTVTSAANVARAAHRGRLNAMSSSS